MSAATSGDHSNTAPDIAALIRATSNKLDCFAALAMTGRRSGCLEGRGPTGRVTAFPGMEPGPRAP